MDYLLTRYQLCNEWDSIHFIGYHPKGIRSTVLIQQLYSVKSVTISTFYQFLLEIVSYFLEICFIPLGFGELESKILRTFTVFFNTFNNRIIPFELCRYLYLVEFKRISSYGIYSPIIFQSY